MMELLRRTHPVFKSILGAAGSHKGQGKSVHWRQKFWTPACCCKCITRKPKTQRIRRKWCPAKQCVRTKTPTKAQPGVMQDVLTQSVAVALPGGRVRRTHLVWFTRWWRAQASKLKFGSCPYFSSYGLFTARAVECDNGVCVQSIKRHYHTK